MKIERRNVMEGVELYSPDFLLFLWLIFQLFLCCCLASGMDNSISSNSIFGCSQKMRSAILYLVLTLAGVSFTFNTVKLCFLYLQHSKAVLYCKIFSELAANLFSLYLFSLPYSVLPAVPLFVLGNLHNMCPLMGACKIFLVSSCQFVSIKTSSES